MPSVTVTGSGRRASASFPVDGAKHSFAHSLACMAIAHSGVMNSVPNIEDSRALIDVLRLIFNIVEHDPAQKLLSFSRPKHPETVRVAAGLTSRSRNILCLLPALLFHARHVVLEGVPSGCQLGQRPIDWYLDTLRSFGVITTDDPSSAELSMTWPDKRAASIRFDYPTMTGTVIAVAAAGVANGFSRIEGASVEPSCADQLDCLRALGGTAAGELPNVTIGGGGSYGHVEFAVSGDRIHAVTMVIAAMLSRGEIEVTSKAPLRIPKFVDFLCEVGIEVTTRPTSLYARYPSFSAPLASANLVAGSEPLFSSDWAPFAALLLATRSSGSSIVSDNVFLRRFQFADALAGNDLDIRTVCCVQHGRQTAVATINGRPNRALKGGNCRPCDDIRGSAALLLSAIVSSSPVRIADNFHLARGYENLPADLEKIGVAEMIA